jgi:ankyrin repeat protein
MKIKPKQTILYVILTVLLTGCIPVQEVNLSPFEQKTLNQELISAVREPDIPLIGSLIKKGADVNVFNYKGTTPLIMAAERHENERVFQMLIDAGADVNIADSDGGIPLIRAVKRRRNPFVIELLIDAGADVNMSNYAGKKSWDYIQKNKALKETDVYFYLRDATIDSIDPDEAGGL